MRYTNERSEFVMHKTQLQKGRPICAPPNLQIILMKYEYAPDLQQRMIEIAMALEMDHLKIERIQCLRSYGSSSRRTIARCHALGKLMQKAMQTKAFYAIEFLERFEKMSKEQQDKTIIHELMHIPKTFGGGFRQHDFVCEQNVDLLHQKYENLKQEKETNRWF